MNVDPSSSRFRQHTNFKPSYQQRLPENVNTEASTSKFNQFNNSKFKANSANSQNFRE